uniref:Uncharacterized protein n=1 Tax=Rhizophora mucronata TaxID=61149 RepID=A0A2P2N510_RHIMU
MAVLASRYNIQCTDPASKLLLATQKTVYVLTSTAGSHCTTFCYFKI